MIKIRRFGEHLNRHVFGAKILSKYENFSNAGTGFCPNLQYLKNKYKSFKPRLSDTLRLDEREVCLSIPKLPEAKLRRVMRRSLKPEKANGVRSEAG